jgi:hypothetical protein
LREKAMRTLHNPSCWLAVIMLGLSACGGSPGSDALNAGPEQPLPTITKPLGSRAMPGTGLSVTAETPLEAGRRASIRIEAAEAQPGTRVQVAVGSSYENSTEGSITMLTSNSWRASVPLPEAMAPDTRILISLILADGSVLESGPNDFTLVP